MRGRIGRPVGSQPYAKQNSVSPAPENLMRLQQLFVLRCPQCRGQLACEPTESREDELPSDPYVHERVQSAVARMGMLEIKRLCQALGWPADIPDEYSPSEELDNALWALLVGREVISGELRCEGCGTRFDVRNGIPRMLVK